MSQNKKGEKRPGSGDYILVHKNDVAINKKKKDIKIDITKVSFDGLKKCINDIGYNNVLKILVEPAYNTALYTIIYEVRENEK